MKVHSSDPFCFETLCRLSGIELTLSGVEIHNSVGAGERYPLLLRALYKNVKAAHPNFSKE